MLVLMLVLVLKVSSFPSSESPIELIPSLVVGDIVNSCIITLIDNQYCNSWNEIITTTTSLHKSCPIDKINQVVLHLQLAENGTQFDRFGALWINDIEILRTTTAEPTTKGISWTIEKDVTIYLNYFIQNALNLTSYLSIPNNVDSTYTGIINVNASLIFYFDTDTDKDIIAPTIVPLTKASSNGFWNSMQISGNQTVYNSITFRLPLTILILNLVKLHYFITTIERRVITICRYLCFTAWL